MSVPSILEEITLLPDREGVQALVALDFVAFGGAQMKSIIGEKLARAGVRLLNHYGTTESGPLAPLFVPKSDYNWRYFRLRKDLDLRLEPEAPAEDGVQRYSLITHPFGWETTFKIQDQLVSNPQQPTTDFNAIGRKDDVIVFATGEKVPPLILETMLSESELINTAVAFGDGQFELGVVVQPSSSISPDQYDGLRSSIWPIIVEAGQRMDAHARISSKNAIVVISPGTELPRSDKGSLLRKEVYKMFELEIAHAYRDLDDNIDEASLPLSIHNFEQDLRVLMEQRLGWKIPAEDWASDDDLFELGLNSIQALQLRRLLLGSFKSIPSKLPVAERIPLDFIYKHPSLTKIANALRGSEETGLPTLPAPHSTIDTFVKLYSLKPSMREKHAGGGCTVLLTGATGSLGAHLLAHLASLQNVARIICLARPKPDVEPGADPCARQQRSFEAKNITVPPSQWPKIEILESNPSLPLLGLTELQYTRVSQQVTHILHNAWPVDFKRELPSFEAQFKALQNLLNLARDAHLAHPYTKPRFLFISSIAVVGQYPSIQGQQIIPEIPANEKWANQLGYAKAKLVCERIICEAARLHSEEMELAYVRVGQMSGAKKSGYWNTAEHIAALIKSSQSIGYLPRLEGVRVEGQILRWRILSYACANVFADMLLDSGRLCS